MESLKKHYEKILLSVVLVGLAVAAGWLVFRVSAVRESLDEASKTYFGGRVEALPLLDMSTNQAALKRLKSPPKCPLGSRGHNVFNPITWKRLPDGRLVAFEDTGLKALVLTNLTPLYLRIEYLAAQGAGENTRYQFMVTREASPNPALWHPISRMATLGNKNEVFVIKDIKGPKDNPSELVLELNDTKASVSVAKNKPYNEVAGYAADLRYDPENRLFNKQRTGQKISFAGSSFTIVAISSNEVTLEDSQTTKRTPIRMHASP
jgi:hypothetical protein